VSTPPQPVDLTVVLVAHDGAAWLPDALAALAAQTVRPRRVLAVDTGSTDATPVLLAGAAETGALDAVLTLTRRDGFGTAVRAALAPDGPEGRTGFVWLLHDDCAPEPDALEALLREAGDSPSGGVFGPKVLDWADPRRLVEVGVSTDRAGFRETGLERREWDQGQHDAVRDVLAVGTAGALVRREVWDEVDGLDEALPLFRDDLDLGWRVNAAGHRVVLVPQARVRHVRAATTGRRALDAARGRAPAVDRRNALFVLAAHAPLWLLPLHLLRLVLGTLLRVVGLLLWRQPVGARDEVTAAAGVLLHPVRLARARRRRTRTRTVPRSQLRHLITPRRARTRARVNALADLVGSPDASGSGVVRAREDVGPDTPEEFAAEPPATAALGLVWRPSVVLTVTLAVLTLVVARDLVPVGGGVLVGGRLLPAPDGARDLFEAYAASWHPTSVGSADPAPPYLAVLGALSTLLLGKAWLAVDLLLLGSVPLGGLTAWWAAGAVSRSSALRMWAALTWALLPVATGVSGIVAAGRLDLAVGQITLPLLVVLAVRVLTADPLTAGWWPAWGLGGALAVTTSFLPALWVLAAGLLVPAAVVGLLLQRSLAAVRRLGAVTACLAVPLLLLLPWSGELLRHPEQALLGIGPVAPNPVPAGTTEPTWHLALLSPGGSDLPQVALTGGLVLVAALGVLRLSRRGLALGAWLGAVAAVGAAVVAARITVDAPRTDGELAVWPGPALQVAGALLLVAALVAGDGLRTRLARRSFGLRQLGAGAVALVVAATPVALAVAWVQDTPASLLTRDSRPALPAFAAADLAGQPGLRALSLRPAADGSVAYALTTGRGDRLGGSETLPDEEQGDLLDAVVADLLAPRGSDAAQALATRAVRYVALPAGEDAATVALTSALDAQPALVRRTRAEVLLWEVAAPVGRLTVLGPETARAALSGATAPSTALQRSQPVVPVPGDVVPPGPQGRLLVLSEASDSGWRASIGGRDLPRQTAWGWATAFALPPAGGEVVIARDQSDRRRVLLLQAVGLAVLAVLTVPSARRRRHLEDAEVPA
jgi:GT2 family glycosyltransferase